MERASRLNSASISRGNLTIRDGGNVIIEDGGNLYINDGGDVVVSGTGSFSLLNAAETEENMFVGDLFYGGVALGRGAFFATDSGKLIAVFSSNALDGTVWCSLYDGKGTEMLAADRLTGYGLALPYFHYPFIKNDVAGFFSTVSGTFVLAYTGYATFTSPRLEIGVATTVSGTATGVLQVSLDGVPQGANQSFTGGEFKTWIINIDQVAGAFPGHVGKITVEIRRSAGTGTPSCQPEYMIGHQS